MYKIALTGKAKTGKNTVARILKKEFRNRKDLNCWDCEYIAFANPIKSMIRLMFPQLPEKCLTGSSKFRSEIIPGAFKDGKPLTVRQLLIDLGTGLGRSYKEDIWLDTFNYSFNKAVAKGKHLVIVTDVRFRNEFDHLKSLGFYQIKLLRDSYTEINHASETNQDSISDDEFDSIINNNGSLSNLKKEVSNIVSQFKV